MLDNFKSKIDEIETKLKDIAQGLITANKTIVVALKKCELDKFSKAKSYIKNVSNKTADIDHEIVTTLALHTPEAKDLRKMVSYLKITNELLRACTNTRNFIKGFQDVCEKVDIKTINEYAIPMQKSTVLALESTIKMIGMECADETQECFNQVLIEENKTDDLYDMIETTLLTEAKKAKDFTKYHQMLSSLRKSEKVADRAMSIASLLLYAKNGGEIHQV